MPIPAPNLDNRKFQDIVNEAKRLIPRYCPEWTDHNVSDPGVMLIELFAWMTEMLTYRVNQIPERMNRAFLNMLGTRLIPPKSARVKVSFFKTPNHADDIVIPIRREISTVRTETEPAIPFLTTETVTIHNITRNDFFLFFPPTNEVVPGNDISRFPIPLFSDPIRSNDSFYICFNKDLSQHILTFHFECEPGKGIEPDKPPFRWSTLEKDSSTQITCKPWKDSTKGFSLNGDIKFTLPRMERDKLPIVIKINKDGKLNDITEDKEQYDEIDSFYILRCNVDRKGKDAQNTPRIKSINVTIDGRVINAEHGKIIEKELLGISTGIPGQSFQLKHTPVLPCTDGETIQITETLKDDSVNKERKAPIDNIISEWKEVDTFANSSKDSKHYTLDYVTGHIRFPPSLLRTNGQLIELGCVPPMGAQINFTQYRTGGGTLGNVAQEKITVLASKIEGIKRVVNHEPATGGQNAETIEAARLRVANFFSHQDRAVTRSDYIQLASRSEFNLARVQCYSPGELASNNGQQIEPGTIRLVVIPKPVTSNRLASTIPRATPPIPNPIEKTLDSTTKRKLENFFKERQIIGTKLIISDPEYVHLTITVDIKVLKGNPVEIETRYKDAMVNTIARYFSPFPGVYSENSPGWPFGVMITTGDIFSALWTNHISHFNEEAAFNPTAPTLDIGIIDISHQDQTLYEFQLPYIKSVSFSFQMVGSG